MPKSKKGKKVEPVVEEEEVESDFSEDEELDLDEDEEDDDDSKAGVYDGGDGDERFQRQHVRAGSVALLRHRSGPNVA